MKSICIKTNNKKVLTALSEKILNSSLDNTYISFNEFKYYKNIIIHFKGKKTENFYNQIARCLSEVIIKYFEPKLIKKMLNKNYCYFSSFQKKAIIDLYFQNETNTHHHANYTLVYDSIINYLKEHNTIVLQGFYNFRLSKYKEKTISNLETYINQYLIENEYYEFINLVQYYVQTSPPKTPIIYLEFKSNKIIVLDYEDNILDIKSTIKSNSISFLSDITFSENDLILNFLLNSLPSQIIVHLPNELTENFPYDFFTTLKLIYQNKIFFYYG